MRFVNGSSGCRSKPCIFERGSSWENGYNESFNGKFRDQLLNRELFYSLAEAKYLVENWRQQIFRRGGRPIAPSATGRRRQPLSCPSGRPTRSEKLDH